MGIMRKLSKQKTKIKAVIYGDYGTRKSGMAVDFAKMTNELGIPMRVLYIDFETESLAGYHVNRLQRDGVDTDNILVLEPDSIDELQEVLKKIQNHEPFYEFDEEGNETEIEILDSLGKVFYPDAIVLDSASALVQDVKATAREISKIRTKVRNSNNVDATAQQKFVSQATADLELADYGRMKGMGEKLVSQLIRKLDTHVAVIVRTKPEKVTKYANGKATTVDTGKELLDSWDFLQYEGNVVIHAKKEVDENNNIISVYGIIDSKDRTGKFAQGEKIPELSMTAWQSIIDDNVGKENSSHSNRLSQDEKVLKSVKVKPDEANKVDYMVIIKDTLFKMEAEEKKAILPELKSIGIAPKKITDGDLTIEELKQLFPIFEKYIQK